MLKERIGLPFHVHIWLGNFSTDLNGVDLNPVQDTPVASRKEDTYIHFNIDVEIQKHVEKLTKGKKSHLKSFNFSKFHFIFPQLK